MTEWWDVARGIDLPNLPNPLDWWRKRQEADEPPRPTLPNDPWVERELMARWNQEQSGKVDPVTLPGEEIYRPQASRTLPNDPWVTRAVQAHQQDQRPQDPGPIDWSQYQSPYSQVYSDALNWLKDSAAWDMMQGRMQEIDERPYRREARKSMVEGIEDYEDPSAADANLYDATARYRPWAESWKPDERAPVSEPKPQEPEQHQGYEPWLMANPLWQPGSMDSVGAGVDPATMLPAIPNPGAVYRNVTRLPVLGPGVETVERWLSKGVQVLNLGYDLAKSKRIPGVDASVGEMGRAALEATGTTLAAKPEDKALEDYGSPMEAVRAMGTNIRNLMQYPQRFKEELDRIRSMSTPGEDASPEVRHAMEMARINSVSGPEAVRRTRDLLLNKDEVADQFMQQAITLRDKYLNDPNLPEEQRMWVAQKVASMYSRARRLKEMEPYQVVEQNTDPVAEIGFSFILDPLEWMGWVTHALGLGTKARRIRGAVNSLPDAETARKLLEATSTETELNNLWRRVGKPLWNKANPFALTPESKALNDAAALYTTHALLLSGVGTKEDARLLLRVLRDNPQQLLEGVTGLTSPSLLNMADESGAVRFGTFMATDDVLRARRVYQRLTEDSLMALPALQGEGPVNPLELLEQLDDLVYEAARQVHGAAPMDIPPGTVDIKAKPTTDGKMIVEYYGPSGTLIHSDPPRTPMEAQRWMKQTAREYGQNFAQRLANFQRSLTSEIWLNMRPAQWFRNGASATGHLMTDGIMTLEPTDNLLNWFATKTGSLPNRRLAEGAGGVVNMVQPGAAARTAETTQSMFRNIPVVGKPLAAWSEKGAEIWGGMTAWDVGKLFSVPIGEQNFYLRAFTVPARETFAGQWTRRARQGLDAALEAAGMEPELRRTVVNTVVDAGLLGSKEDVAARARQVAQESTLPFSPQAFGIAPDTLSPQGWEEVQAIVQSGMSEPAMRHQIMQVFQREQNRFLKILDEAPPQPGRYVWSDMEAVEDGADLIQQARTAAKRAGLDPDEAEAAARDLVKRRLAIEDGGRNAMFQAAQGLDPQQSMPLLIDAWTELFELKKRVREDNAWLVERVLDPQEPVGWDEYFSQAARNWEWYNEQAAQVFQRTMDNMERVARGEPVATQYNPWWLIERYTEYDEAEIARARQLQPTSPKYDSETFKRVIDANRAYVDRQMAGAWAAGRRYMDSDTMDILVSAERDTQVAGLKTARYVENLRAQAMAGDLSWDEFYRMRNDAWSQLAEAQAARWRVAQYEIVKNKVAPNTVGDVTVRQYEGWPDMERDLHLVGPAGKDDDGTQLWRAVSPEGEDVLLRQSEIPEETLDQWRNLQDRVQEQVDREVASLQTETQSPLEFNLDDVEALPFGPTGPQLGEGVTTSMPVDATPARPSKVQEPVRVAEFAGLPDEVREGLDWRLLRGMSPERAAEEMGLDPMLANRRQGALVQMGYIQVWSDDLDRLGGPQRIWKLSRKGRRRLGTLDKRFKDGVDTVGEAAADLGRQLDEGVDIPRRYRLEPGEGRRAEVYRLEPTADSQKTNELYGLSPDDDLREAVEKINRARQATRTTGAPEVGDMALYQALRLEEAQKRVLERLPNIVQGHPNTMTAAQRKALLDWMTREGLSLYDNVLAGALEAGRRVADFAMLNYANRRNLDTWLSLLVPYHYWFTRSAINWIERSATRPGMVAQYMRVNRLAENERQQSELPQRFQGTIPIPGTNLRMRNPLEYLIPYGQLYSKYEWEDPEQARGLLDKIVRTAATYGFGLLPLYNIAVKAATGRKEDIGTYFWPDTLAYRAQQAAGVEKPWTPETAARQWFGLPPVDQWDPYRQAREVAKMVQAGEIDPGLGNWLIDAIVAKQRGEAILPESPKNLEPWLNKAMQSAAADRLLPMITGLIFGVPVYNYDQEEAELRRASRRRSDYKYDVEQNPAGSRTAQNALFDIYPGLSTWYSRSATVPGSEEMERPGVRQAQQEYYQELRAINEREKAAINELYKQNPDATYEDEQAVRAPFEQERADLRSRYPSVPNPERSGTSVKPNMAPWEEDRARVKDIIDFVTYNYPGKPEWPGDDATWGEKVRYYQAMEAWNKQKAQALERILKEQGLEQFASLIPTSLPGADILAKAERMIPDIMDPFVQSGRQLIWDHRSENWPEAKEEAMARREQEQAARRERERQAMELFGEEIFDVAAAYPRNGTPEEKRQYLEEHPELKDFWEFWFADEESGDKDKGGGGRRRRGSDTPDDVQQDLEGYPWDGTLEEKRAYLLSHPALAAYWKQKYGRAWWEEERRRGGGTYRRQGSDDVRGFWVRTPQVRARQLDPWLRQYQVQRDMPRYRPAGDPFAWLRAGGRLAPRPMAPWRPMRG